MAQRAPPVPTAETHAISLGDARRASGLSGVKRCQPTSVPGDADSHFFYPPFWSQCRSKVEFWFYRARQQAADDGEEGLKCASAVRRPGPPGARWRLCARWAEWSALRLQPAGMAPASPLPGRVYSNSTRFSRINVTQIRFIPDLGCLVRIVENSRTWLSARPGCR